MPPFPFDRLKETTLGKLDKSPKGSIDEPILPLLGLVNAHPDWVSTSSCSGRIAVYLEGSQTTAQKDSDASLGDDEPENTAGPSTVNGKGGGRWLFVSHSTLKPIQLSDPVMAIFGGEPVYPTNTIVDDAPLASLKYEAPVLHLAARSIDAAFPLLRAAISAGFRNSGVVVSGAGKVMLAVRAAPGGLDVPIAQTTKDGNGFELLVSRAYLQRVWHLAGQSMRVNEQRIARLMVEFKRALDRNMSHDALSGDWEPSEARRDRLRREGLAKQEEATRRRADVPPEPGDACECLEGFHALTT